MKNKMKSLFMAALMGAGLFFTSCADTENITPDENTQYDGKLTMKETEEGTRKDTLVNIFAEDVIGDDIKVLVNFTSTSGNMRRVYVTRNVAGAGEEPYTWEGSGIENNGDGSVNLDAGTSFVQELHIPKNSSLAGGGTEEFKLWATNGKGDYRDVTNSFRVGVGTIRITYGSGNNPAAPVKAFTAKLLAAPLADGSSQTFISLIDGQPSAINNAAEKSAFWDFGYYYLNADGASLASTNDYPEVIIDVRDKAGLPANAPLNKCFFKASNKTSDDFDDVAISSDLNNVTNLTSGERIKDLAVGDIVEFVDNYGKKGLIRVKEVVSGFGTGAHITIDIKVQR